MNEKIGIIGVGKIGGWFAEFFALRENNIFVYDTNKERVKSVVNRHANIVPCYDIEELYKMSGKILVSVTPKNTREVLLKLGALSKKYSKIKTLVDTTSYKGNIINVYNSFPAHTTVASIHPLFGPGANKDLPHKYKIAIVPVPGKLNDAAVIKEYFASYGFRTKIIDAATHDRIVAKTIGLPYLLGLLTLMVLENEKIDSIEFLEGTSFKILRKLSLLILNDTPEFIEYVLEWPQIDEIVKKIKEFTVMKKSELVKKFELVKKQTPKDAILENYKEIYNSI